MIWRLKSLSLVALTTFAILLWRVQMKGEGREILHDLSLLGTQTESTQGIYDLLRRRMPLHADSFELVLGGLFTDTPQYDQYMVTSAPTGKIRIEGTTLSALSFGLRRYMTEIAHVDIYWYIGSRLHTAPLPLPMLEYPLHGDSNVKWRYHFNPVTFSYTAAFWSWADWELQLDWMALHGINLPLALSGTEKILFDTFEEIGLTTDEILTFLTGPPFQSWSRLGNIRGQWNGKLSRSWIEEQSSLNQRIINRMVQLGMTPVLPAFAGFVPEALSRVHGEAHIVNGTRWSNFPAHFTGVPFLEPSDPLFTTLQKSFIEKQRKLFKDTSHMYLLDQYNENQPARNDPDYLRNTSHNTLQSLKAAVPNAVWLMPSWLFSDSDFWNSESIEAWFSGIQESTDVIVLDLFSESRPQWQSTNSYSGNSWIWNQLHNFGGNMGLGGQIMNLTINATEAASSSDSLVGFGLAMEGQEQENQVIYDLLLDQAWSRSPLDTEKYFQHWATARYSSRNDVPQSIYEAWEIMRTTVYNNTDLQSSAVSKSIFGLEPSVTGLVNRTGRHPTTIHYDKNDLLDVWRLFFHATIDNKLLWDHPAFCYDLVDITRQVIANEFISSYESLIDIYNSKSVNVTALSSAGERLLALLDTLDMILDTNEHFRLSTWVNGAIASAENDDAAASFAYDARDQISLWGPGGEISDYASKDWSGLVSTYYRPRWEMFIRYLQMTPAKSYNTSFLHNEMLAFGLKWQERHGNMTVGPTDGTTNLKMILSQAQQDWPLLLNR